MTPTALPRRALIGALASLATLALCAPARAQREVAAADARAIRALIEGQLQAFAADDAARAFGFASAAIRAQFGDAPTFLRMVRQAYPVVYRPASTAFFKPEWVDDSVRQVVQMRDAEGRAWLATYQLVRQGDGAWRINGCAVLPDGGRGT